AAAASILKWFTGLSSAGLCELRVALPTPTTSELWAFDVFANALLPRLFDLSRPLCGSASWRPSRPFSEEAAPSSSIYRDARHSKGTRHDSVNRLSLQPGFPSPGDAYSFSIRFHLVHKLSHVFHSMLHRNKSGALRPVSRAKRDSPHRPPRSVTTNAGD